MVRLLTLREAAETCHVSYYNLRDAVTANRLEHVRLGPTGMRGVRVTEAALDRYLASLTHPATERRTREPEHTASPGSVPIPARFATLRSVRASR